MQVLRAATSHDEVTLSSSSVAEKVLDAMLVTALAMLSTLNPIQPPSRTTHNVPAPAQPQMHSTGPQDPSPLHQTQPDQEHSRSGLASLQHADANGPAHMPLPPGIQQEVGQRQASETQASHLASQSLVHRQAPADAASALPQLPGHAPALPQLAAQVSHPPQPLDTASGMQHAHSTGQESSHKLAAVASSQGDRHTTPTDNKADALDAADLGGPRQQLGAGTSTCDQVSAAADSSEQAAASQQQVKQLPVTARVDGFLERQVATSPFELAHLAQHYPRGSPYKGYRVDLVALLANLSYRRSATQQKVQQLGGVELILSQCQVNLLCISSGLIFVLSGIHRRHVSP